MNHRIMSQIDPKLIEAYRLTIFRVWDKENRITFRVEIENPELDSLLEVHSAPTAAFLTACNPGSQVFSPDDNDHANEALLRELGASGFHWLDGDGVDPEGEWTPETSVMVLGIGKASATEIAKKFGQNSYVWIRRGEPPLLVLTR